MERPKRWEHDHPFVLWMAKKRYVVTVAGGDARAELPENIVILMWEAWRAGQDRMATVLGGYS